MLINVCILIAAGVAHMIVGALVVRSYLNSAVKLHARAERLLMLGSGIYGWLLLRKFREAKRRRLKKVSNAIAAGQKR